MNVAEAARLLCTSPRVVRRWISDGSLAATKSDHNPNKRWEYVLTERNVAMFALTYNGNVRRSDVGKPRK